MIAFADSHPLVSLAMLWLAVVGLGHISKVARELVKQPFLFYRHIADGRRMARHRADMREIYEQYGTDREKIKFIADEFDEMDEKIAA
jgi:hypothetical protein